MAEELGGGLKSVAAALDLLDCFADEEELGVSEVARRLGVAKSTAHRLLTTLVSRGLVEQDPRSGKYHLGLHLWELGHLSLSRMELRRRAMTLLEELREASGWTVHLSIARDADSLFLERLATLRGLRAMPHFRRRWPLHVTGSGKAICAFDPQSADARARAGFPVYTPATIDSAERFAAELDTIRRRGYAISNGELMPALSSVAAPILDQQGVAFAAISITGATPAMQEHADRYARLITVASRRLSRSMASISHH